MINAALNDDPIDSEVVGTRVIIPARGNCMGSIGGLAGQWNGSG